VIEARRAKDGNKGFLVKERASNRIKRCTIVTSDVSLRFLFVDRSRGK